MEANDFINGRNFFDEAVSLAPGQEKEEAATAVKQIPGIRNVYSMKELAHLSKLDSSHSKDEKHNSASSICFNSLRKKIANDVED